MKESSYYYGQLTDEQKKTYMVIYEAWKNKQREVTFQRPEGWEKAYICRRIRYDHPMLFYVGSQWRQSSVGSEITISTDFLYTDKEIEQYEIAISKQVEILYNKFVKDKKTTYEKVLAIHDCLCRNIEYDSDDKANKKNHNVVGLLFQKSTVCEGVGKAFKLLCDRAMIHSIYVTGNAPGSHGWNIVYIDNQTYQLDVTWDITMGHVYDYFNLTDEEMFRDHEPDKDLFPNLKCTYKDYNYFYKNNYCARNYRELSDIFERRMKAGEKKLCIKLLFDLTQEQLKQNLYSGDSRYIINNTAMTFSVNEVQKIAHFTIK